jgi:hypothetical protein
VVVLRPQESLVDATASVDARLTAASTALQNRGPKREGDGMEEIAGADTRRTAEMSGTKILIARLVPPLSLEVPGPVLWWRPHCEGHSQTGKAAIAPMAVI